MGYSLQLIIYYLIIFCRDHIFMKSLELFKEQELGGKPFIHIEVPKDVLPTRTDYSGFINFLRRNLPDGSHLKQTFREFQDHDACRGFTRVIGSREYFETLRWIAEFGVDRGEAKPDAVWFDTLPTFLPFAVPKSTAEAGLFIISSSEGMVWSGDFETDGVGLRDGVTFKSLHLETIQIVVI